ncbi:MAG: hypothetical protein NZM18_04050 [Thermoflexales bacterium]|nr:hypothetical protein [Thermoflexales bacterium]MDW8352259.1 hypothetical protein [Anaerolineae bacterium]
MSSESNTAFIKGVFATLAAIAALVAIYEFVTKPQSPPAPEPPEGTLPRTFEAGATTVVTLAIVAPAAAIPADNPPQVESKPDVQITPYQGNLPPHETQPTTRQELDVQHQQIGAMQTAFASSPATAIPPQQPRTAALTDCGRFAKGETRAVSSGTFVVGDVYVNDVKQHDDGDGEGTVVLFERDGVAYAPYGAGCYRGSIAGLEEIVEQQFRDGCGSKCSSVRIVIVKSSGEQVVSYRR